MMLQLSAPLVSIIIPCYNAERWVGEAIESCVNQTYRPLEIIIIDDGSTDGSLEIIQKYVNQHAELIRYETGPNQGGCIARNRGLTLSRGEYILFLDADDFIEKQAIAEHVKVQMEDGTKLNISVSDWKRVRDLDPGWEVIPLSGVQTRLGKDDLRNTLTVGSYPVHTILYPRYLLDKVGWWDEELTRAQDVDLLIRALVSDARVLPVQQVLAYYRYHSGHFSGNSVSADSSYKAAESASYLAEKLERIFTEAGIMSSYNIELSRYFYSAAGANFNTDRISVGNRLAQRARELGGFHAIRGTLAHRIVCITIGLRRKEMLASFLGKYGLANKTRRKNFAKK